MYIKKIISLFKEKPQPAPAPEPKKWAKVYMNLDFMNIQTHTKCGLRFADPEGDNLFLKVDACDDVIGEAVLSALEKSQFIVPNTRESERFFANGRIRDFYPRWVETCQKTYGYKTKKALYKGMKNVNVENYRSSIILRPWHQEKSSIFGPTKNKEADNVVIAANSSAAEIGKAVRLALSRATSAV